MNPLEWLARNVEVWDDDHTEVVFGGWFVGGNDPAAYVSLVNDDGVKGIHTKQEWQAERERLGLDKAVEWNGEGNPPAGTECERSNVGDNHQSFRKIKVKYIGEEFAVVVYDDGRERAEKLDQLSFRPIKTEREKAIDSVMQIFECDHLNESFKSGAQEMARMLREAGLLK